MNTKRTLTATCLLVAALCPAFTSVAQPVVTKVASGGNDTLYLKSDGSLWGFGANAYGELGDGTGMASVYPEEILSNGVSVTAIAMGQFHSLLLKSDGSLWAMGYNAEGQLGDGTRNNRLSPVEIQTSNVVAIAAGANHSLFVKSDGTLWGMGDNSYGELGDGASGNVLSPQPVQAFSGVTAIAAGGNHELIIKKQGTGLSAIFQLWVMGDNASGELGVGNTNTVAYPNGPVELLAATMGMGLPVRQIATGINHSLFIKSDGSLWGMGANRDGELGDGTHGVAPYYCTNSPEQILPSGVTAISAGDYHSLFMKSDGSLWAMGSNLYGALGDGHYVNDGVDPIYGTNSDEPEEIVPGSVTALAAGGNGSLFVQSDGSLWGMGADAFEESAVGVSYGTTFIPYEIILPPPPPLGIAIYNNQPTVIFPASIGYNYLLQMSTNLASGVWGAAPNGIPISGVQFTNAPPNAFFRLQPPF